MTISQSAHGYRNDLGEFAEGPKNEGNAASLTRTTAVIDREAYVAPDVAALRKQVVFQGNVMTWGEVLEQINPEGTHVSTSGWRSTTLATFVTDPETGTSWKLPAPVAKASGLPDITPDLDRARAEHEVAQNALDKYEARLPAHMMLTSQRDAKYDELKLALRQAEWDIEKGLNEEAAAKYLEDGPSIVREAKAYAAENGRFPFSSERVIGQAALADEALALELLEYRDKDGLNVLRTGIGEQGRHAILDHESPKVRVSAVRNGLVGDNFGIVQQYIARYPQDDIITAANDYWAASGHTGKFSHHEDREEKILFDDPEGGNRADTSLNALHARYRFRLMSPKARHEEQERRR